jgi:hypothetical protein
VADGEGEDGMVEVVEGGDLGRLVYLNDLGVIMVPKQEWAQATARAWPKTETRRDGG